LGQFCALFAQAARSRAAVLTSVVFLSAVSEVTSDFPAGYECDAHEFLLFLFTSFDKTIARLNDMLGSSAIPQFSTLFQSEVATLIQCGCGQTKTHSLPFLCIPIGVHDLSIKSSIKSFLEARVALGSNDLCHPNLHPTILRQFTKLPTILVFHVDRFRVTDFGFKKEFRHVPLDSILRMRDSEHDITYSMKAVVIHIGHSIEAGHYITIYKSGEEWVLADDESAGLISDRAMSEFLSFGRISGGYISPTAYLIFYERMS
jgi:uncharacterized UBP type Zn finger protein